MLGSLGKKAKQKEQWHWMHVFIGLYLWKLDEIILLFHLTHVFFGAKRFVTGLLHSYLSFFSECFFCPKIPWGIGFCKVEWKFLGMRETCNRNARMTCLWKSYLEFLVFRFTVTITVRVCSSCTPTFWSLCYEIWYYVWLLCLCCQLCRVPCQEHSPPACSALSPTSHCHPPTLACHLDCHQAGPVSLHQSPQAFVLVTPHHTQCHFSWTQVITFCPALNLNTGSQRKQLKDSVDMAILLPLSLENSPFFSGFLGAKRNWSIAALYSQSFWSASRSFWYWLLTLQCSKVGKIWSMMQCFLIVRMWLLILINYQHMYYSKVLLWQCSVEN